MEYGTWLWDCVFFLGRYHREFAYNDPRPPLTTLRLCFVTAALLVSRSFETWLQASIIHSFICIRTLSHMITLFPLKFTMNNFVRLQPTIILSSKSQLFR